MDSATQTAASAGGRFRSRRKVFTASRMTLFALVLPCLVLIFAFSYIPLFGWLYAFYDFKPGIPLADSEFVGFKFFRLLFEDKEQLFAVLINTFALGILTIIVSPLSAVFAILLNETTARRFKKFIQTATTLPNFISWIIVFSLATAMFASDGMLNTELIKLGWISGPHNVMANPGAAWAFQTAVFVWKTLGWGSIIYLAAIAGIDTELYDAATVDGASRYQRIWNVTVPGLLPTFFVLTLLNIAGILSANFEQYFVFNNSLVAGKIETLDLYAVRIGISSADVSFGTAIGMAKSLVSIVLLFLLNSFSRRVRGDAVF